MKKFLIATVAAAVAISPIAAAAPAFAAPQRHTTTVVKHKPGHTVVKKVTKTNYRNWRKGERFDHRYARNYRQIDYNRYHLKAPPRGYRYVQSGNDAVLVGITSGIVAAVLANVIR